MVNPGSNNPIYYFPILSSDSPRDLKVIPLESIDGSVIETDLIDGSGNSLHKDIFAFLTSAGISESPGSNISFEYLSNFSSLAGSQVSTVSFNSNTNDISFLSEKIKSLYSFDDGITDTKLVIVNTPITTTTTTITNQPPDTQIDIPTIQVSEWWYPYEICEDGFTGLIKLYFDASSNLNASLHFSLYHAEETGCSPVEYKPNTFSTGTRYKVESGDCYKADTITKLIYNHEKNDDISKPYWTYRRDHGATTLTPEDGSEPSPQFGKKSSQGREYKAGDLHKGWPDINPEASRTGQTMDCRITLPNYITVKYGTRVTQGCPFSRQTKSINISIIVSESDKTPPQTTVVGTTGTGTNPFDRLGYDKGKQKDQNLLAGEKKDGPINTNLTKSLNNLRSMVKWSSKGGKTPGHKLSRLAKSIKNGWVADQGDTDTGQGGTPLQGALDALYRACREAMDMEYCSCVSPPVSPNGQPKTLPVNAIPNSLPK